MNRIILITLICLLAILLVVVVSSHDRPPAYDPIKYYDRNGIVRVTKVFIDTFNATSASGYTVDLTPAAFSSIKNYSAIALKNSATSTSVPNISVKSVSTASLVLNVIEGNGSLINILGSNVLLGPSTAFASTSGLWIAVRVEGN